VTADPSVQPLQTLFHPGVPEVAEPSPKRRVHFPNPSLQADSPASSGEASHLCLQAGLALRTESEASFREYAMPEKIQLPRPAYSTLLPARLQAHPALDVGP
jgi:hypothetical protein